MFFIAALKQLINQYSEQELNQFLASFICAQDIEMVILIHSDDNRPEELELLMLCLHIQDEIKRYHESVSQTKNMLKILSKF